MFKKLFLLLFFIFFILLFININESKASFDVYHDGELVSLPDLPVDERVTEDMYLVFPYMVAYSSYNKTYAFYIPRSFINGAVITGANGKNGNYIYYKIPSQETYGTFYGYLYKNGKWEYNSGIKDYLNEFYDCQPFLFASNNIYGDDGTTILFNASFHFDLNFYEDENFYQVISNLNISYSRFDYLTATITDENDNTFNLNWEFSSPDNSEFAYYYNIYKNGTYTIKITDSSVDETYFFIINCTEIDEEFRFS